MFRDILMDAAPESALSRHQSRQRSDVRSGISDALEDEHRLFVSRIVHNTCGPLYSLPADIKEDVFFMNVVAVTYQESEDIAIDTVMQTSSKWRVERQCRITASECYALYTYNGNAAEKLRAMASCSFKGNAATRFGKAHEDGARQLYEQTTGNKVHRCGLRPTYGSMDWMFAGWHHRNT